MTKEIKHSPLPWNISRLYATCIMGEFDGDDVHICSMRQDGIINTPQSEHLVPSKKIQEENAEFIVRAVNNHYQLIEALECLLNEYKIHFEHHANCGDDIHKVNISESEKALQQAKGE